MSNILDGVPVVQSEGQFLKFVIGEPRHLKLVSFQKVKAEPKSIDKGFADKEGNQLQLEFADLTDGNKQKFYYAKDGSSKLIQALKNLPTLAEGTELTITKSDEYNFTVALYEGRPCPF